MEALEDGMMDQTTSQIQEVEDGVTGTVEETGMMVDLKVDQIPIMVMATVGGMKGVVDQIMEDGKVDQIKEETMDGMVARIKGEMVDGIMVALDLMVTVAGMVDQTRVETVVGTMGDLGGMIEDLVITETIGMMEEVDMTMAGMGDIMQSQGKRQSGV